MIDRGPDADVATQQMKIIWFAFIGAIVMYGVVCVVVLSTGGTPAPIVPLLRVVFAVLSAGLAGVSFWLRSSFLAAANQPQTLLVGRVDDRAALARTRCIIAWALADAIAVFGLVLAILARSIEELLPFAIGALLLLYLHRPDVWPLASKNEPFPS